MNIDFIVGGRSDGGLLEILYKTMADDDYFKIRKIDCSKILATAGNLLKNFGGCTETDKTVFQFAGMFKYLPKFFNDIPDAVIVLGDRFEILAASIIAHFHRIPIIHLHGGENTFGAYDEAFRHCITKLSHLHFAATEEYRRRIIQLGENSDTVFNVGSLGVDGLVPRKQEEVKDQILVLYHPVTLEESAELQSLIDVLHRRAEKKIVIGPNIDPGCVEVGRTLKNQVWEYHNNLPREDFLNLLRQSKVIVGNGSVGIIEAPVLGVPTIDIGSRQAGRMKASSIISVVDDGVDAITKAFERFDGGKYSFDYIPYHGDKVAERICFLIRENLSAINMRKEFFDIVI